MNAARTRRWCRLAITVIVVWPATGPGMRISRVSAGMPPEGAPRSGYVQASVFAHEVRVTLTTAAMERGPHRMVLQLTEGNRFLSGLPVAISVSRPLRPIGTARPMHGSGASYWADIDVAQGGDW